MSKSNRTQRVTDPVEAKVVGVKDNEGTYHAIMMTRFDGRAFEATKEKGFRGEYILYTVMDAGVVASHYDPRDLRREAPFIGRNDTSYELMVSIHDNVIPWDRIVNNSVVDPVTLDEMKNG